jgi:hypothetical protein
MHGRYLWYSLYRRLYKCGYLALDANACNDISYKIAKGSSPNYQWDAEELYRKSGEDAPPLSEFYHHPRDTCPENNI